MLQHKLAAGYWIHRQRFPELAVSALVSKRNTWHRLVRCRVARAAEGRQAAHMQHRHGAGEAVGCWMLCGLLCAATGYHVLPWAAGAQREWPAANKSCHELLWAADQLPQPEEWGKHKAHNTSMSQGAVSYTTGLRNTSLNRSAEGGEKGGGNIYIYQSQVPFISLEMIQSLTFLRKAYTYINSK